MDKLLSGITKSSSMPITLPKPSQFLQAPNGLLKLKKCEDGSEKIIPSISNLLEKECNSFFFFSESAIISTKQSPAPS